MRGKCAAVIYRIAKVIAAVAIPGGRFCRLLRASLSGDNPAVQVPAANLGPVHNGCHCCLASFLA